MKLGKKDIGRPLGIGAGVILITPFIAKIIPAIYPIPVVDMTVGTLLSAGIAAVLSDLILDNVGFKNSGGV